MWVWIDRLGRLVLDASLPSSVLVGVIALAMVGCRQPSRRVGLARAAIVGSLALFPLVALSPFPRIDLISTLQSAGFDAHPAWPYLGLGPAASGEPPGGFWEWLPEVRPSLRFLTVLYLGGVCAGLAWLILGWWGLGWLARRSTEPSPAALELYRSLPYAGTRRPGLRVASRIRGPALIGIARQTILVPPSLDRPEAPEPLRLALLHELAHAEESDPWFGLAGGLAGAFWFFLPPLWWVRTRMRLDHEFLADRRAASGFGTSGTYAASLLELAAPPPGESRSARRTPVPVEGPGSAMFQRLLMLVRCPFPVEPRPPRWWRWSLPMGVALATLASSSLSPRRAETSPPLAMRPSPSPTSQSFRMTRLIVPASPSGPNGRAPAFKLPIRLPDDFELNLEVWADPATLAQMRVAGHLLGTTQSLASDPTAPEAWHLLRVRRDPRHLHFWIDDQTSTADPPAQETTPWLTVEPVPSLPLQVKNLSLIWPRDP